MCEPIDALLREIADFSEIHPDGDDRNEEKPRPDHIGKYRLVEKLGEGGSGVVYRAREARPERDVALKIIQPSHEGKPDVVKRFCEAAEIAAPLEHPNIVRVYDTTGLYDATGARSEKPFYTMQLVNGGTLARPRHRGRARTPREAAKLMTKVADAIHFAHEEGVLHRDLKPSNILLDFNDEPYVADFIAKRVDDPVFEPPQGTVPYMAPEQAAGEPARKRTDVYGLGAVFYELLTGKPPTDATTLHEAREVNRAERLVRWRQALSHVDVELREICLAALAEDPLDRQATAHVFADGLQRALEHRPLLFPPTPRVRRIRLWTRRHPLLALSAAIGMAILIVADISMFVMARVEQTEMCKEVLRTNAALANAQARGVFAGLKRYADYALQSASLPGVAEALARGPSTEPVPVLLDIYERSGALEPSGAFLVGIDGVLVSRHPSPLMDIGRNYAFRDYYQCAKALAERSGRAVCITPAYRSEADDSIQFAFSSPVYDSSGKWMGAMVISRNATPTLGEIEFNDRYRSSQLTAVIGGRGPDRNRPANRRELIAVVHPDLHGNGEFPLEPWLAKRLMDEFNLKAIGGRAEPSYALPFESENYVDPVSIPPERMLASFAPVGQTGYVVAVATPYQKAQSPTQRLINLLFTYGSVLNLCFVVIAALAVWASSRESPSSRLARADSSSS
jgi:serine/threonine-protein kinase